MANIARNTTLYLLKNIPFDKGYTHTRYFSTESARDNWILSTSNPDHVISRKEAQNYIKNPLSGTIRVAGHEENYLDCNYICFQNTKIDSDGSGTYGNQIKHYAFVDDLKYVSNGVFEIDYTIDVVQTYLIGHTGILKECMVLRENVSDDNVGAHLEPEHISFGNYVYQNAEGQTKWTTGYANFRPLVFSTYELRSFKATGNVKNRIIWGERGGIMQGLVVNVFKDMNSLITFFDDFEQGGTLESEYDKVLNSIVAIVCVPPEYAQPETDFSTYEVDILKDSIYVGGDNPPSGQTATMDFTMRTSGALGKEVRLNQATAGYTPVNKKLYTYPYNAMIVTNNNGKQLELRYEYFNQDTSTPSNCQFRYRVAIQPNFEITVYPINYAGKQQDLDSSIDVGQFPIVPYVNDSYQQWLGTSKTSSTLSALMGVLGGAAGLMTGGAGLGILGAMGGLGGVASLYDQSQNADRASDAVSSGFTAPKMLASGNTIRTYQRTVNEVDAKRIDMYFTQYGYAVNTLKKPDFTNTKFYHHFVQTHNCIISGGAPASVCEKLQEIFNRGITFWDSDSIGNYVNSSGNIVTRS